jgi:hypothetical protein
MDEYKKPPTLAEIKTREFVLFLNNLHKSLQEPQSDMSRALLRDTIKCEIMRLTEVFSTPKTADAMEGKSCQRCGEAGLMWDKQYHKETGSWRLMDIATRKLHRCRAGEKTEPSAEWRYREKKLLEELGVSKVEPDDFMSALKKLKD